MEVSGQQIPGRGKSSEPKFQNSLSTVQPRPPSTSLPGFREKQLHPGGEISSLFSCCPSLPAGFLEAQAAFGFNWNLPSSPKKPSPEKMEKGDLGMLQRRWELDLDLHLPLLSLLCCKHNSIKSSFPSCPDVLMELEQEFARDNGDLEG